MRYVKWTLLTLLILLVGGFFHYTLPQRDIIRIVNTDIELAELRDWTRIFWSTPDTQTSGLENRDVQFINAFLPNGKPMVYRNEDTGWGWPPYFKFDTSNLYTEANDAKSTKENPEWFAMTHYGWRNEWLSIFPNAVSLKPVDGPDVRLIPWLNIFILTVFALVLFLIVRMWRQFRERAIDPLLEDVDEGWDHVTDEARERTKGFRGWLGTWRGKPRN